MSVVSIDRRSSNTLSICNKKFFSADQAIPRYRDCYISLQEVHEDIWMSDLTLMVKQTGLHTNTSEEPSKHYFLRLAMTS